MQAMLDIIWELEGPAPPLDEFVDWHRAGLLMHVCYDIFRIGQERCATLEIGLQGGSDGLTPTSPATTIEKISGNNRFYNDNECNDNDNNDIIDRGNNSLNINNDCNDYDDKDIINSRGGGDNTDDGANKNNNDNNQFEDNNYIKDINHSFFGATSDNCGDEIDKKEIIDTNGAIGIAGVTYNDSADDNHSCNNSHGYGDEAKEDMEIERGSGGAFGAAVWQRMGVG
ncbi:hypothetical protein CBR_g56913 [Chara braunii]|uniref:Uncharacterized protein n=1 Tax=Chara braunii TaxID=69332 RepID=A0A388ME42_CHABU|nr:hypothetical protein CBR_g56913 [Chara braunii]|eukprot:GBG92752.1 hypothetical protein CBR_g56913 [Chara braunii]